MILLNIFSLIYKFIIFYLKINKSRALSNYVRTLDKTRPVTQVLNTLSNTDKAERFFFKLNFYNCFFILGKIFRCNLCKSLRWLVRKIRFN